MNFLKVNALAQSLKFFLSLGFVLGLSACFEVKQDTPALLPVGTIQGTLLDSTTLQPVVGASIDIGGSVAISDATGQFRVTDIKVQLDAGNTPKAATYKITFDLRNVTSPVNMLDSAATPRYMNFVYDRQSISFASATISTSTPANYLLENIEYKVGKLAANFVGIVADKNSLLPVAAGYTVKLFSLGTVPASGSGIVQYETLVGSTLTDSSGGFVFNNVESFRNFRIDSNSADRTFLGSKSITAPADSLTRTMSVSTNDAILLSSTDTLSPTIINVTPQMDADIAPAATDVVFTFSEPILQTVNTSTSPSIATGLYYKVDVRYLGGKASNIARTLAWNTTFTQLKISIPSLATSSKYTIDLTPANALFKDLSGNALDNTIDKRVLNFTTYGAVMPAAPDPVTVVNSTSLNYNSPTVLLNWLPVSGAKAYNVYRAQNFPSTAGQMQLIGTNPSTLTSDFSDTLPAERFVSGQNKLTYSYVVTSVSADNIESAPSSVVTAEDNVKATATIPTGLAATYTITFSEPMDEASATTLSNYLLSDGSAGAGTAPRVVSAVLNAGLTTVTLTLNATTTIGHVLAITGIKDISGKIMTSALRTFNSV